MYYFIQLITVYLFLVKFLDKNNTINLIHNNFLKKIKFLF